MAVFWKNGFSGTSVRQLGTALDMRPGSLYASFQSKEKLYVEALEMYAQEQGAKFEQCMQQGDTFMAGLGVFFEAVVKHPEGPCVCMLGKAVSAFETEDLEVRAKAEELMGEFEARLTQVIGVAKEAGEFGDVDCGEVARFTMATLMGLRCFADGCSDPAKLDSLIEQALRAIENCGRPQQ